MYFVKILLVTIAASILLTSACGGSEPGADAGRSPAPRIAPSEEPEENFDEAPPGRGGGAPPPAPAEQPDKAAGKICGRIGDAATASSPEDYLESLAQDARREGVQFARLITLLQRAYVKGNLDKARTLIDRLAGLCEEATGRRNF